MLIKMKTRIYAASAVIGLCNGSRLCVQCAYVMSPVSQRGGDMLLYLCAFCLCFLSHSFLPALSMVQAVKHETLTQCWANVGPPSTTLCQH